MSRFAVLQEIEESRQDETRDDETDTVNYSGRGAWRRNTIGTVIEKRKSKQAIAENLEQKEIPQFNRPYVDHPQLFLAES